MTGCDASGVIQRYRLPSIIPNAGRSKYYCQFCYGGFVVTDTLFEYVQVVDCTVHSNRCKVD